MVKLASNDEIIEVTRTLVKAIKQDKSYHDYLTLREKIINNKEIMLKMKKIKELQQKYVKSAYLDTNIELELKKELKALETIPLYKEYIIEEKKINNIFSSIKEGIDILFNNILNINSGK